MSVDRGLSENWVVTREKCGINKRVLKSALNSINTHQMDAAKYTFIRQ